jgi:hypothetical protein
MRNTVERIVSITAENQGWDKQYAGREYFTKLGYEVFFYKSNDGFALTIRNPETSEREAVFDVLDRDISTSSPLYVALVEHVFTNAENIVSEVQNGDS